MFLFVALFLTVFTTLSGATGFWHSSAALPAGSLADLEPAQYVDPLIGTDAGSRYPALDGFAGGNVFPGADFPHGMLQWSPDTTTDPGGYRYSHSRIYGFSLTHLSGGGCRLYQDVPFMPTIGPLSVSPAETAAYAASFSHAQELASAGYYRVYLQSSAIEVALSVTARSGFAQFTYPPSQQAMLLINTGGSATGDTDRGTGVEILGSNWVVGSATSGHFCRHANTYTLYFAATFDTPFTSFGTWNGSKLLPQARTSSGSHSGAYLRFATTAQPRIQVRVGISFVSIANARANLQSESPDWDFQAVRSRARAAWNTSLSVIQVPGATLQQKRVLYTALYHSLIHPNVFSDVNGQYLGFDQRVHTAQGFIQYANFPGWDMYRSLTALLALLDPETTSQMMQSLIADAQQGGGGLPRWAVANEESGVMGGDSADVMLATSYAFGANHFDLAGAWQTMQLGARQPGTHSGDYLTREGLSDYLSLGYVSTRLSASAALTLEYSTDDFALAQFATALGNTRQAKTYLQRSHNWQHLFDQQSGYIEPRNPDGTFPASFDPTSEDGFAEGDSLQYSWMVPHDLAAAFAAMGGTARVIARLDEHFTRLNDGPTSRYAFMGNEPEFGVPWEYDFAGVAYRTQEVIRRIETELFLPTPDGLPGNDDGGAMSSWYVLAALGLYPEIPGVAGFALSSPLFPLIRIQLGDSHLLWLQSPGASDALRYVQRLQVNGHAFACAWLPFEVIRGGARLHYSLASSPNRQWGRCALTA